MKTHRLAASLVFLGSWLVAGAAHADPQPAAGAAVFSFPGDDPVACREARARAAAEKGYAYTFGDDPLTAPGVDPGGAMLRVRPRGLRTTLTRPRLHFVPELLRSVEAL